MAFLPLKWFRRKSDRHGRSLERRDSGTDGRISESKQSKDRRSFRGPSYFSPQLDWPGVIEPLTYSLGRFFPFLPVLSEEGHGCFIGILGWKLKSASPHKQKRGLYADSGFEIKSKRRWNWILEFQRHLARSFLLRCSFEFLRLLILFYIGRPRSCVSCYCVYNIQLRQAGCSDRLFLGFMFRCIYGPCVLRRKTL